MNRKLTIFICIMALGTALVASCNKESRSVLTVASINNNARFFSDVLDQGVSLIDPSDDFVQEDNVTVLFLNRPGNSVVTTGPGLPFNDFLITRYRVEWQRAIDSERLALLPVLPTSNGATSILVPSNELIFASILLVPFEQKNTALLSAIAQGGANFPDEILMIARITFFGHETGVEREQSFSAELSVSFGDPVVTSP